MLFAILSRPDYSTPADVGEPTAKEKNNFFIDSTNKSAFGQCIFIVKTPVGGNVEIVNVKIVMTLPLFGQLLYQTQTSAFSFVCQRQQNETRLPHAV